MLERVGVHALVAAVHHVVGQVGVAAGGELEGLVAAGGGDDGVGGGDGGDDVLHDPLGERVCHAGDVELRGAAEGFLVEPGDVLRVVGVEGFVLALFFPCDYVRPFDAVLGLPGDGGEGAEGDCGSRGVHVELAFDAG